MSSWSCSLSVLTPTQRDSVVKVLSLISSEREWSGGSEADGGEPKAFSSLWFNNSLKKHTNKQTKENTTKSILVGCSWLEQYSNKQRWSNRCVIEPGLYYVTSTHQHTSIHKEKEKKIYGQQFIRHQHKLTAKTEAWSLRSLRDCDLTGRPQLTYCSSHLHFGMGFYYGVDAATNCRFSPGLSSFFFVLFSFQNPNSAVWKMASRDLQNKTTGLINSGRISRWLKYVL